MDSEIENKIRDIEIEVSHACNHKGFAKKCPHRIAKQLYLAGYGKIENFRKQVATELISHFYQILKHARGIYGPEDRNFNSDWYLNSCDISAALKELEKSYEEPELGIVNAETDLIKTEEQIK